MTSRAPLKTDEPIISAPSNEPIISTTPPVFSGTYVTGAEANYDESNFTSGIVLLMCDARKWTEDSIDESWSLGANFAKFILANPQLARPLAAMAYAPIASGGSLIVSLDTLTAVRWRRVLGAEEAAPVDVEIVARPRDDPDSIPRVLARATGISNDGSWIPLSKTIHIVALQMHDVMLRVVHADEAHAAIDAASFDVRGALFDQHTRRQFALWEHADTHLNIEGVPTHRQHRSTE